MVTFTTRFLLVTLSFLLFSSVSSPVQADEIKLAAHSAVLVKKEEKLKKDYRTIMLKEFLSSYSSPLAQHADTFVRTADIYNLDWRLVAAISGVESTFAHHLPHNSYNAWGWGIYGDNMIYFTSYDEAIETISKSLRERYMDEWGATNVYQIGRHYAASPTWASRVDYFMNEMEKYALSKPEHTLSISL